MDWRKVAAEMILGEYGDDVMHGDVNTYGVVWRRGGSSIAMQDEQGFYTLIRCESVAEAIDLNRQYIEGYRVWLHGNVILDGEDVEAIRNGTYVREGVEAYG